MIPGIDGVVSFQILKAIVPLVYFQLISTQELTLVMEKSMRSPDTGSGTVVPGEPLLQIVLSCVSQ